MSLKVLSVHTALIPNVFSPPEDIRFMLGIFGYIVCAFFMAVFIKQLLQTPPASTARPYSLPVDQLSADFCVIQTPRS